MNGRNSKRYEVLKAGTISFRTSNIDCTVHNISIGGANLEVESDLKIPDAFRLVIDPEFGNRHCHVVWRKDRRIGVAFD
jgi:PilZ domain-containing protein